jgi:nucleoside-diphosphate-sugar epimerase
MRILVTGGAGFIGSILVPELLKEGHEVTVLDNLTWGMHGLFVNLGKRGFEFFRGDVRDDELIKNLLKNKDAVVHLAAIVGEPLCELNRELATDVNVNATKKINKYLSNDQNLIFASTGSVYGELNGLDCTEKMNPSPRSHYATTKFEAEKILSERQNVVTLRFATAFGVSYRMRLDLLVNQFVYEAVKHKVLTVYGEKSIRSVIHVRDISRSILFAINNRKSMMGQIFNVGSSKLTFSKEQIAQRIKNQVNYDLRLEKSNDHWDKRNYILSTLKIEAKGYLAKFSLDEGIFELVSTIKNLKVDNNCFNDWTPFTSSILSTTQNLVH